MNLEDNVFDWSVEEKDDSDVYFDPTKGNVIFARLAHPFILRSRISPSLVFV